MRNFRIMRHKLICTLPCKYDVLLLTIDGLSNAMNNTVLCHFSVKSLYPITLSPLASYCDCVCVVSNFLGLICMYQDGMTALMLASRAGHHHVVDSLIQAGASVDRKSNWVRT